MVAKLMVLNLNHYPQWLLDKVVGLIVVYIKAKDKLRIKVVKYKRK